MSVDVAVPASAVQALLKRARALVKKTPPVAPDPWPYPRWIAHRGAGKLAPENTLAAFRLGAAHGFRAFECDVKLSADGVPFLLHDAELDRTTSGHGLAALLRARGVSRVVVVGLAGDVCVAATATDAARLGFATTVVRAATASVEVQPGDEERAFAAMAAAGVQVV